MNSDFEIFPIMLLRELKFCVLSVSQIFCVYCERKRFFLICSFYCWLIKEGWALKVAQQFAIRGLVAYKRAAYVVTLPFQYFSESVGTWNSPMTFNQLPQEEATYRTWTWLDLYEKCCLYDFISVRIMFSRCKDIL